MAKQRKKSKTKQRSHKQGRWTKWLLRIVLAGMLIAVLGAGALWLSLPDVTVLEENPPESTAFIDLRRDQASAKAEDFKLQWKWRPLKKISPYLRVAVILSEDPKFWGHAGIDWKSLEQVAKDSWKAKRVTRGGSTITQQLAKNLYLSPDKTYIRKLREFFIAQRLEKTLSKERILEIYLNVVEWGDGVFGAQAAARHWYRRDAKKLTPAQAVKLAAALPNPYERNPKAKSKALNRKRVYLLIEMRKSGLLSKSAYLQARRDVGVPSPSDRDADSEPDPDPEPEPDPDPDPEPDPEPEPEPKTETELNAELENEAEPEGPPDTD